MRLSFFSISKGREISSDGVIIKSVPIINYAALSYSIYALLFRIDGLDDKKKFTLRNFLHTNPHILWAVKCVGPYNLLTYICVENNEKLMETLNTMRSIFPETKINYEILIAYEEYKYTYFPDYGFL